MSKPTHSIWSRRRLRLQNTRRGRSGGGSLATILRSTAGRLSCSSTGRVTRTPRWYQPPPACDQRGSIRIAQIQKAQIHLESEPEVEARARPASDGDLCRCVHLRASEAG